jgi:hypothetical protein
LVLGSVGLILVELLVFLICPLGAWESTTEVFVDPAVEKALLEAVDDFFVGDINDDGALLEEASHVGAEGFVALLLHLLQIHLGANAAH